jgi:drug/metabolite transporter (DMT)-like permease
LILSALVLHEQMSVFGIVGSVLIIGAALVSEMGDQ